MDNKKHILAILLLGLIVVGIVACNDSNNDSDADECIPEFPSGSGAIGTPCMEAEDCESGFCNNFSHAPADPDAVCAEAPVPGDVHVRATVVDLVTDEVIPNQVLDISGAMEISGNPTGYPVFDILTSDADGRVDAILSGDAVALNVGIMALGQSNVYYPSVTGMVKPEAGCATYIPGVRNSDIRLVKKSDITNWSELLAADFPSLADEGKLPLGDTGGVIGIIKGVDTGDGIAGATVKSELEASPAEFYYLNEAGDGFVNTESASSGLFVIVKASLGEKFNAFEGNTMISRREATAGESKGIVFVTTLQVDGR